jgi:NADH-quinone oxidoreductase subunit M
MTNSTPWLSLAIWIPIVFGVLVLAAGRDRNAGVIRTVALVGSLLGLLVTLPLWSGFDASSPELQFVERALWIDRLNSYYHLGVDGISVWFVLLTAFITVIVVLAGWEVIESRVAQYYAAFLILSGLMIGVFSAADGLLFYVFFEATLIPMYIIIGVWGGSNRVYAALKFFLYTLAGSLLMLVALVYLYTVSGGKFGIFDWHQTPLGLTPQILLFLAFLAAFAVKVPMWPVHTWLPDAHVEAPTGGSIVLAAIMLKLGAYGFLRFSLPITPDASQHLAGFIIALSLIAVIYIGLVALVQSDMKKLVAYSSIAHMGFVTLGFFIFEPIGMAGGIVQMISHGFVSGAMFFCIGVMYDRMHSRSIADYGGVVNTMPQVRGVLHAVRHGQCRPARHQRLRGRVHGDPRRGEVRLLDRGGGCHDARPRRRLFVVDVQAGRVRRDRERERRGPDGRQRPRIPDPAAARHRGAVDGRLPEAGHRPDGRVGQAADRARAAEQAAHRHCCPVGRRNHG